MKIAYHQPALSVIYAHRTIFYGFKNAFEDMGHEFYVYTAGMNLEEFLDKNQPDIFITGSHFFWRKQLNFDVLSKYRKKGMKVCVRIDFWNSPFLSSRINEARSMKDDEEGIRLIVQDKMGDVYFHVAEQNDPRMDGFTKTTGRPYHTVPLAADKLMMQKDYSDKFKADISFIGTYLPQKREYFKEWLLPLKVEYDLKVYGQDWTLYDRTLGNVQRVGQYFNLPLLKTIQRPKLDLGDEAKIYASSKVLVNIHEDYQRYYGGDCNERTFKIPACGGLEISDDVACIRKYYKEGEEIVIAKNKDDWFEKINYYMNHESISKKIASAGYARTLRDHTYHNRAQQLIDLCQNK